MSRLALILLTLAESAMPGKLERKWTTPRVHEFLHRPVASLFCL
jgi:hypothetical protein